MRFFFLLVITAPNEDYSGTWKKKSQGTNFGSLRDWLKHYRLEKHENTFIKHGFDNIDFVGEDIINDADLATMGINDPQDKHDLMEALKRKGYSQGNVSRPSLITQCAFLHI